MRSALPKRLTLNGIDYWVLDGRLLPVLAGGDDGDDPPADPPEGEPDGEPAGGDDAAKLKREAAEYRRKLRAAEAEVAALKQATMSDSERLEARAKAAEERAAGLVASVQTVNLKATVQRLAKDFGIVDPSLAARLVERDKVSFSDDTHEPEAESVKSALKVAVEEYPSLTRAGDSDGGRRTSTAESGADKMNELIRGVGSK